MATFLLLARHGETEDNARQIFQGQGGGPLNALGRAQAERLAARVAHAVDVIVSSDLLRARETALIVANSANSNVKAIAFDPALREVDIGAWTGLFPEEVAAQFPDEWNAWNAGVDVARGGGESYERLAARVMAALARIANANEDKRVLVVSHGAAIRSSVCAMLGLTPGLPNPSRVTLGSLVNASVTTVVYDGAPHVLTYNDHAHIAGLAPPLA